MCRDLTRLKIVGPDKVQYGNESYLIAFISFQIRSIGVFVRLCRFSITVLGLDVLGACNWVILVGAVKELSVDYGAGGDSNATRRQATEHGPRFISLTHIFNGVKPPHYSD